MRRSSIGAWIKMISGFLVGLGISVGASFAAFWGIFYKLTPWVINQMGDVPKWVNVLIYAIVAYFGGLMLPLCILVIGVGITIGIIFKGL